MPLSLGMLTPSGRQAMTSLFGKTLPPSFDSVLPITNTQTGQPLPVHLVCVASIYAVAMKPEHI